jgi:cytochrome c oxidase assembly protein subunit 11
MAAEPDRRRRHATLLTLLAVAMFGFAFALVPLYNAFCELTGLNGRTSGSPAAIAPSPRSSQREVTIQFLAQVAKGMPWELRPEKKQLTVRLGEMNTVYYHARNRARETVTGQAVPSVAPGMAAPYLRKIECFCFTQQELEGGADRDMRLVFYVSPDLPDKVRMLSLSYTLFRVEPVADAAGTVLGGDEHGA